MASRSAVSRIRVAAAVTAVMVMAAVSPTIRQTVSMRRNLDESEDLAANITNECEVKYMEEYDSNQFLRWFTMDQLKSGMVIVPIIGCLWTFLALSIVCDEFFVPALNVLVDRLGVDDDVAGATFMAAGGSAPELFTSFIGTFKQSAVGFGTIVGSAVFNVLFVIGMCAVCSKKTLTLTWWPLARDTSYYCLSLFVLAMFFGPVSIRSGYKKCGGYMSETCKGKAYVELVDGEEQMFQDITTNCSAIWWWEAGILFAMYGVYCMIMAFNKYLQSNFDTDKRELIKSQRAIEMKEEKDKLITTKSRRASSVVTLPEERTTYSMRNTSTFRAGIWTVMKGQMSLSQMAGNHVVAQVRGDVTSTFDHFDADNSGYLDRAELKAVLQELRFQAGGEKGEITDKDVDEMLKTIASDIENWDDSTDEVSRQEFMEWYKKSSNRVVDLITKKFHEMDSNNDGTLDKDEVAEILYQSTLEDVNQAAIDEVWSELLQKDENHDGQIGLPEFKAWYLESNFYTAWLNFTDSLDEAEQPVDLSWPVDAAWYNKILYLLAFPIMVLLTFTIPDVRKQPLTFRCPSDKQPGATAELEASAPSWNKGTKKTLVIPSSYKETSFSAPKQVVPGKEFVYGFSWSDLFPVSFLFSIVWVGIFSFLMVDWATSIGCTFGIPDAVMGLTFLAAGTSVPDLLTSVIVAKQGKGDMAVSSSIGSNIFDVLVGLPLPWMIYSFVNFGNGPYVMVQAPTLFHSLLILFVMIFAVIMIIKCCKWRMTKALGYSMFFLYVLFVLQDLSRSYGWFSRKEGIQDVELICE